MKRALIILGVSIALLCPSAAWADEAAWYNDSGAEAFRAERYAEAARSFHRAWELSSQPVTRKNEAIAWFKAGRCKEALLAAASYFEHSGTTRGGRNEAMVIIANCKVEMADTATLAGDFELADELLDETEAMQLDTYTREKINLARVRLAAAQSADDERSGRKRLGAALTATGGGLVVAAVAYHVAVMASTVPRIDDVAADGDDRDTYDQLSRRLRVSRWLVPTLYAAGAGTAGVGIYLLARPSERRREAQDRAAPSITAQLGVGGTF